MINVVGISDMMVTNDIDETLIAYSLGSSLGAEKKRLLVSAVGYSSLMEKSFF